MENEKRFNNAIGKLTKKGVVYDFVNSSELNPLFFQFDFKKELFKEISVVDVMDLFNKYYKQDNYFTYLDVKKFLIRVDGEDIEKFHQYKKNMADIKVDVKDIDILIEEMSVYISVYIQLNKELNFNKVDLSDYDVLKQIMINKNGFSDGSKLYIYDVNSTSFSALEDMKYLFSNEVYNALINNSDKLVKDLIKVPDLIEQFKLYYDNEEAFDNIGAYNNILNVVNKLKEFKKKK